MDVLVDFESLPWQSPRPGVRLKAVEHGDQRLRLVEFSEGYEEPDWCTQGHAGRVLEGAFTLELRDRSVRLAEGDALFLPAGDEHAHRPVVGAGERVLLLLVEPMAPSRRR